MYLRRKQESMIDRMQVENRKLEDTAKNALLNEMVNFSYKF